MLRWAGSSPSRLVHEEDDFFIDTDNGDNVAVLTEAPADQ